MGICDSHTVMEFADDLCSMKIKSLLWHCQYTAVTCSDYYTFNTLIMNVFVNPLVTYFFESKIRRMGTSV